MKEPTTPTVETPATKPPDIELSGSIAFRSGGRNWGSENRMALLAAIGTEGSITGAARKVGLSYKAAWDAIDGMNNLAGEPLVTRTTGGKRGGGASLSERAHELLRLYEVLNREHERFMARLTAASESSSHNLELMQHMMVQTSARNRLLGTVTQIKHGAVNDEVTLSIADNLDIIASITSESVQNLGLVVGRRALAFVKASSVMVGTPGGDMRLSARNQINGHVTRIVKGAVNADVTLELVSGHTITAMLSLDGLVSLGLKEGVQAYAIFKASSVMMGVAD